MLDVGVMKNQELAARLFPRGHSGAAGRPMRPPRILRCIPQACNPARAREITGSLRARPTEGDLTPIGLHAAQTAYLSVRVPAGQPRPATLM
jgi:hypothetical protein